MIDWLREVATPERRVKAAGIIFVLAVIGWPATSLTVFSGATPEQQGILGLSWLAIILAALQLIVTTDVRRQQEDDDG